MMAVKERCRSFLVFVNEGKEQREGGKGKD